MFGRKNALTTGSDETSVERIERGQVVFINESRRSENTILVRFRNNRNEF